MDFREINALHEQLFLAIRKQDAEAASASTQNILKI